MKQAPNDLESLYKLFYKLTERFTPAGQASPLKPWHQALRTYVIGDQANASPAISRINEVLLTGCSRSAGFAVHPADPVRGNFLGTDRLAFEVAAAAAEALGLHLALHRVGTAGPFRLPLRQLPQVRQLGRHEQACRGIAAAGDAGATTDAGCCAEGAGGLLTPNGQGIAIRGLACAG